jgi:hypothetical protein
MPHSSPECRGPQREPAIPADNLRPRSLTLRFASGATPIAAQCNLGSAFLYVWQHGEAAAPLVSGAAAFLIAGSCASPTPITGHQLPHSRRRQMSRVGYLSQSKTVIAQAGQRGSAASSTKAQSELGGMLLHKGIQIMPPPAAFQNSEVVNRLIHASPYSLAPQHFPRPNATP